LDDAGSNLDCCEESMNRPTPTTRQKALALNLDARTYGTFAEIGGGQEVVRAFFAAGGAAGTVAKSISAYDMAVSDSLYGAAKRYVSRERLEAMLALEFSQLVNQLGEKRGESKCFFAFANTVATRRFGSDENGRGWLGVRFQAHPREEPSGHHPCPSARQGSGARAGGARGPRGQPDLRGLLHARRPRGADRLVAR